MIFLYLQVSVSFVNDLPTLVEGVTLEVTVWSYEDMTPRNMVTIGSLSFVSWQVFTINQFCA